MLKLLKRRIGHSLAILLPGFIIVTIVSIQSSQSRTLVLQYNSNIRDGVTSGDKLKSSAIHDGIKIQNKQNSDAAVRVDRPGEKTNTIEAQNRNLFAWKPKWQQDMSNSSENKYNLNGRDKMFLSAAFRVRIYEHDKAKWTIRELKQWLHYMFFAGVEQCLPV